MTTAIQGTYNLHSATNLTQSVTRNASIVNMTPIVFTPSPTNFSRVYTATFTINSSNPETILIDSPSVYAPITKISNNVYSISSNFSSYGGTHNNWPFFSLTLRSLRIVTTGAVWPNPAFTINAAISDGTTVIAGLISVTQLAGSTPIPATLSASRTGANSATLTWTASTQTIGTGVVGYYVFKNGSTTPLASVTSGLTYNDTTAGFDSAYYTVQAYDGSGPPVVSSLSNAAYISADTITAPTITIDRTTRTSATVNWSTTTSNYGVTPTTYQVYIDYADVPILTTTSLSYTDSTLTASTQRAYSVRAIDTTNSIYGEFNTSTVYPITKFLQMPETSSSTLTYSQDGRIWYTSDAPGDGSYVSTPIFTSTQWLTTANVSGVPKIFKSADGITWAQLATSVDGYGESDFVSNGSNFIICKPRYYTLDGSPSNTYYYTTDNGNTWSSSSIPETTSYKWWVYYGGGKFIALNKDATITRAYYSTDGINWTLTSKPSISNVSQTSLSVLYANNRWTVITRSSIGDASFGMTSTDGVVWSTITTNAHPISDDSLIYANGKWVCASGYSQGAIATSSNGTTWTLQTTDHGDITSNIIYAFGKFYCITDAGTTSYLATSTDGLTWSYVSSTSVWNIFNTSSTGGRFMFDGTRLVISITNDSGANTGQYASTIDGTTWYSYVGSTTATYATPIVFG